MALPKVVVADLPARVFRQYSDSRNEGPVTAAIRPAPAWVAPVGSILRRLPFARYRALDFLCAAPPPPFTAEVTVAGTTFRYKCDLRDSKQRAVCFLYSYEPQETYLFERIVKPGMTVVDVGANWGFFSLIAAKLAGPTGRVLSLEPDLRMYAALLDNLAQNDFPNVTALQYAVAAQECALPLEPFDAASSNWGVSRLILDGSAANGPLVRCQALDRLMDQNGYANADIVKIDVEGAEEKVLQGMNEGLSNRRYRRILLELHPTILPKRSIQTIIASLLRYGYLGYWVDHSADVTRRMSYCRDVEFCDIIHPLESRKSWDSWPHMIWLAERDGW